MSYAQLPRLHHLRPIRVPSLTHYPNKTIQRYHEEIRPTHCAKSEGIASLSFCDLVLPTATEIILKEETGVCGLNLPSYMSGGLAGSVLVEDIRLE